MRPLKLIIIGMMILFAAKMQAQVSINVNLGMVPPWVPGVHSDVRYYYLPDVDAYYDMRTSMFIFSDNGNWIHRRHLPDVYRDYNLNNCRRIMVKNYYGEAPYTYYRERNRDRERWMAQRADREDRRYGEFNDRRTREDQGWRKNDGRREFKHDNGRGYDHEQKRGWKD